MKEALVIFLSLAFVGVMAANANAEKNGQAKWMLHYAGVHDAKANTCAFSVTDCLNEIEDYGPAGPGRFDVYALAIDTGGIAGTRYGICCAEGGFYFYGWTKCSDFEIPTPGWPGCTGEGNAQTWSLEKPPGNVTLGIFDVYVYAGNALICMCEDPRKGFAEWCDGSSPEPFCFTRTTALTPAAFGCVGFGRHGFNPCAIIGTEKSSWGAVKSLYR